MLKMLAEKTEAVLKSCREECLREMQSKNPGVQRAWYYTHMGEIEMAFNLGLISSDRNTELHQEWREHCPSLMTEKGG